MKTIYKLWGGILVWLTGGFTVLEAQVPSSLLYGFNTPEKKQTRYIDSLRNDQASVERVYKLSNPFMAEEKKEIMLSDHIQVLREIYCLTQKSFLIQTETKVRFHSGSFQLSAWNQIHLDHVIYQIKEHINQHRTYFPDESVNLLIEVKGYSDGQPFYHGQPLEERIEQNKLLSQKRAEEVLQYIKSHTQRYVDKMEFASLAYGEELPFHFSNTKHKESDRRVCEIYCLLYNERKHLPVKIRF